MNEPLDPEKRKVLMADLYGRIEAFSKEHDLGPFEVLSLIGMIVDGIWKHLRQQQRERIQQHLRDN